MSKTVWWILHGSGTKPSQQWKKRVFSLRAWPRAFAVLQRNGILNDLCSTLSLSSRWCDGFRKTSLQTKFNQILAPLWTTHFPDTNLNMEFQTCRTAAAWQQHKVLRWRLHQIVTYLTKMILQHFAQLRHQMSLFSMIHSSSTCKLHETIEQANNISDALPGGKTCSMSAKADMAEIVRARLLWLLFQTAAMRSEKHWQTIQSKNWRKPHNSTKLAQRIAVIDGPPRFLAWASTSARDGEYPKASRRKSKERHVVPVHPKRWRKNRIWATYVFCQVPHLVCSPRPNTFWGKSVTKHNLGFG